MDGQLYQIGCCQEDHQPNWYDPWPAGEQAWVVQLQFDGIHEAKLQQIRIE